MAQAPRPLDQIGAPSHHSVDKEHELTGKWSSSVVPCAAKAKVPPGRKPSVTHQSHHTKSCAFANSSKADNKSSAIAPGRTKSCAKSSPQISDQPIETHIGPLLSPPNDGKHQQGNLYLLAGGSDNGSKSKWIKIEQWQEK